MRSVKIPTISAEYVDGAEQLRSLEQHYRFADSNPTITTLLEEQSELFSLLSEAVRPLQAAFGETWPLQVRVQHSEDDCLVKVAVQLPADFSDNPEQALRSFDTEWWLANCHRSDGSLVFDYEIQSAV